MKKRILLLMTGVALASFTLTSCNKKLKDKLDELESSANSASSKNDELVAKNNSILDGVNSAGNSINSIYSDFNGGSPLNVVTEFKTKGGADVKLDIDYPFDETGSNSYYYDYNDDEIYVYIEKYYDINLDDYAYIEFYYSYMTKQFWDVYAYAEWDDNKYQLADDQVDQNEVYYYSGYWRAPLMYNLDLKTLDTSNYDMVNIDVTLDAEWTSQAAVYNGDYAPVDNQPAKSTFTYSGNIVKYDSN